MPICREKRNNGSKNWYYSRKELFLCRMIFQKYEIRRRERRTGRKTYTSPPIARNLSGLRKNITWRIRAIVRTRLYNRFVRQEKWKRNVIRATRCCKKATLESSLGPNKNAERALLQCYFGRMTLHIRVEKSPLGGWGGYWWIGIKKKGSAPTLPLIMQR